MTLFLASTALKSSVLLALAWMIAKLLGRQSAAVRNLLWTAALAAALALPLLSISLPPLRVPAPMFAGLTFAADVTASPDGAGQGAPGQRVHRGLGGLAWVPNWAACIVVLWAVGAALMLGQMLVAAIAMARLRRRSLPFEAGSCDASELAGRLGLRRPVAVRLSAPGAMPMACGLVHPAVLLPAEAAGWDAARLRVVLLHELAHIRRGDLATRIIARTALSLQWWNPLAWLAWREFLKEGERATDDVVLALGARPSNYAAQLLEVARAFGVTGPAAWAGVAMARRSQLEGRLVAILDSRTDRRPYGRVAAVVAAAAALLLAAPFAAVRAQDQP